MERKNRMTTPKKTPMRRTLVPTLAGWGTYPRAFASVLLLGLAALGGEWVVHQLEYLIEYGGQYGSVMAASQFTISSLCGSPACISRQALWLSSSPG